eukprot:CAMPEP_0119073890 /NCGR_PEP_ID=MMETSP1178-20130426/69797_1 /TAXON_ID=33656 /ORGANISM="unid sp, Strain CCMP2000" /LENGTH=118 /DNA_ID=CAMNT_0007056013 /DNA_START=273 /DNA_END=626 /DNA_ORIENTATION=+
MNACASSRPLLILEPETDRSREAGRRVDNLTLLRDLQHSLMGQLHGNAPHLRHERAPPTGKGSWCFRRSACLRRSTRAHQLKDLGLKRSAGQQGCVCLYAGGVVVPQALGHFSRKIAA